MVPPGMHGTWRQPRSAVCHSSSAVLPVHHHDAEPHVVKHIVGPAVDLCTVGVHRDSYARWRSISFASPLMDSPKFGNVVRRCFFFSTHTLALLSFFLFSHTHAAFFFFFLFLFFIFLFSFHFIFFLRFFFCFCFIFIFERFSFSIYFLISFNFLVLFSFF